MLPEHTLKVHTPSLAICAMAMMPDACRALIGRHLPTPKLECRPGHALLGFPTVFDALVLGAQGFIGFRCRGV